MVAPIGAASSAMPMQTRPPGSFTPAASPPRTAPYTQPRSTASTSAVAIRPTISRSLCRPPTPFASISGDAITSPVASAGLTPVQVASRGIAQATIARPASAKIRCATTSSHGSPVKCETIPPSISGSGPYGVPVASQRGSTASMMGPVSTPGP